VRRDIDPMAYDGARAIGGTGGLFVLAPGTLRDPPVLAACALASGGVRHPGHHERLAGQ
jgi:hypothetical protein